MPHNTRRYTPASCPDLPARSLDVLNPSTLLAPEPRPLGWSARGATPAVHNTQLAVRALRRDNVSSYLRCTTRGGARLGSGPQRGARPGAASQSPYTMNQAANYPMARKRFLAFYAYPMARNVSCLQLAACGVGGRYPISRFASCRTFRSKSRLAMREVGVWNGFRATWIAQEVEGAGSRREQVAAGMQVSCGVHLATCVMEGGELLFC